MDLLEILRELDLALDFGRGVPAGQALIVFPKTCARAFLRAHEALENVKAVSLAPENAGRDLLDPTREFSTTNQLTAWMDSNRALCRVVLEEHRATRRPKINVASSDFKFHSSACESGRFQEGDQAEGIWP